jgi:ornithine decarboxylase
VSNNEAFSESKTYLEHEDVATFFAEHPDLIVAVQQAMRDLNCKSMPCTTADVSDYWRELTAHFVRNNSDSNKYHDLDPFYMVDMGRVVIQMAKFKKHLPTVQPHYAVKCNPSREIIAMLSAMGCSYDCASGAEVAAVIDGNYASPDDIVYANPCKTIPDMQRAKSYGVRYVTFDNPDELAKLAAHMPHCKAILRIKTNDSAAVCQFSTKFGASMSIVPMLLRRAQELGVQVVGCSFHVGSGNNDPNAYLNSIRDARSVFDQGIEIGFEMKVLDLGGGFPGSEPPIGPDGKPECLSFEEIASHIRPYLEEYFSSARVIAEPGRFFTADTHALAMNVHSMRVVPLPNPTGGEEQMEYQYYVNDGLYHSFNSVVFDHAHPVLHVLNPDSEARVHTSTIFGPTCDSIDCLLKRQPFPELALGEWLFVPSMGSYTRAAGAPFNGFETRRTEYVSSLPFDF